MTPTRGEHTGARDKGGQQYPGHLWQPKLRGVSVTFARSNTYPGTFSKKAFKDTASQPSRMGM